MLLPARRRVEGRRVGDPPRRRGQLAGVRALAHLVHGRDVVGVRDAVDGGRVGVAGVREGRVGDRRDRRLRAAGRPAVDLVRGDLRAAVRDRLVPEDLHRRVAARGRHDRRCVGHGRRRRGQLVRPAAFAGAVDGADAVDVGDAVVETGVGVPRLRPTSAITAGASLPTWRQIRYAVIAPPSARGGDHTSETARSAGEAESSVGAPGGGSAGVPGSSLEDVLPAGTVTTRPAAPSPSRSAAIGPAGGAAAARAGADTSGAPLPAPLAARRAASAPKTMNHRPRKEPTVSPWRRVSIRPRPSLVEGRGLTPAGAERAGVRRRPAA